MLTLTIAIPTFNRLPLLRQTIDMLLQQLTSEVELLVMDNCSDDGTGEYLQSLAPRVRSITHPVNIGSDENFLSCVTNARGRYLWTLSDDDFPRINTVRLVLDAIHAHRNPGVVYLRKRITDAVMSDYSEIPVVAGWQEKSRDEFLTEVGVWVTFCSSAVVRRDTLTMDFLRKQSGTSLVPTSIPLQAAGVSNRVIISTPELIFVRRAEPGASYTLIFTRNLKNLLKSCRRFGYSPAALNAVYSSSLAEAMPFYIHYCPVTVKTFCIISVYSFANKKFYRAVVPAVFRKMVRALKRTPRRVIESSASAK